MNEQEWKLREDLCEVAKRLYMAGFMSGSDGNLSTILNTNEVLVTPSRLSKGFMDPYQIVKVDRNGRKISGDLPPSVETGMHLAAYQERPDICSVVHCHPPVSVAFTVAGLSLPSNILPELETIFGGSIPVCYYATPGGSDLADSIRSNIRNPEVSVVLLDHHGLLGVGQDIFQASIRVEHVEAAAKVIMYSRILGGEKPLPSDSLEKLHSVHGKLVEMESKIYSGYCHSEVCENNNVDENSRKTSYAGKELSESEIDAIVNKVVSGLSIER